jgi:hypothetical protein
LLNEAKRMQKTTPDEIDPCKLLNDFEPLSKGTYPVFNKRPSFISDYQKNEKAKILQQELNYLKERFLLLTYDISFVINEKIIKNLII